MLLATPGSSILPWSPPWPQAWFGQLWWARRPLAAARAVIFSQLVHDPEDLWRYQNPDKEPNAQIKGHWTKARARLFTIIEDLVKWENTNNETVLEKAREEIRQSWSESCELNRHHPQAKELFNPEKMPGLHDPFAGGGAIPLEAQRLALEAYASDLNPVAVLINKAMIESCESQGPFLSILATLQIALGSTVGSRVSNSHIAPGFCCVSSSHRSCHETLCWHH